MVFWLLMGCAETPPVPSSTPSPAASPRMPRKPLQPGLPGGNGSPNHPNGGQIGSGAAVQDPSGFPLFHDWPTPPGPTITGLGDWTTIQTLTSFPSGGYRPQLVVGPNDLAHVLYYDRVDSGDIIRHRVSSDGDSWSEPRTLGHDSQRNWGPDLVVRDDGEVVVVYDHALPDFRSSGFLTRFKGNSWSAPEPLTPDDGGEIGSGHVAHGLGTDLAYVYIGKAMGPQYHFQARYRWFRNGEWLETGLFSDGVSDAWHTNVERRPDGSVLAGYDIGTGGSETVLYVVDGRDGQFSSPENISADSHPGERPHFAFSPDGLDHITWFHKERGSPKYIYVRTGKPGDWGPTMEPSRGFGGFHFDPDIAVNKDGVLCLVWGWDGGRDAELVYSLNTGSGWAPPRKVADINWGKPGLPSIDVDSSGGFHVVWNQGVRGKNAVYYARLTVP